MLLLSALPSLLEDETTCVITQKSGEDPKEQVRYSHYYFHSHMIGVKLHYGNTHQDDESRN